MNRSEGRTDHLAVWFALTPVPRYGDDPARADALYRAFAKRARQKRDHNGELLCISTAGEPDLEAR